MPGRAPAGTSRGSSSAAGPGPGSARRPRDPPGSAGGDPRNRTPCPGHRRQIAGSGGTG